MTRENRNILSERYQKNNEITRRRLFSHFEFLRRWRNYKVRLNIYKIYGLTFLFYIKQHNCFVFCLLEIRLNEREKITMIFEGRERGSRRSTKNPSQARFFLLIIKLFFVKGNIAYDVKDQTEFSFQND